MLIRFFQRVECMEKFFLGPFLVFQKLDIVDDKAVNGAILFLKIFYRVVLNGIDDFIGKGFTGNVSDLCTGIGF